MKALTIQQPFAEEIMLGNKWVENRDIWFFKYRGPILIHAGSGSKYVPKEQLANFKTGCLVAVSNLTAVVTMSVVESNYADPRLRDQLIPGTNRTWKEVMRHEFSDGPVCLILEDTQRIIPIPTRGYQGLWNFIRDDQIEIAGDLLHAGQHPSA